MFENGLGIFKSKLLPTEPNAVACIDGPVSELESLAGNIGEHSVLGYMTQLVMDLRNFKPSLDYFPNKKECFDIQDPDIPGIKENMDGTHDANGEE